LEIPKAPKPQQKWPFTVCY